MQERSAFWEGNKKFSQAFCVIWRNLIPSYTLQIIKEKNLIAISGKKTFFLVSGKIRFLFPYDWALELGSAATTATNKTTNILPCYWNPIADFIKNLECCKTVPYDSPLTPPPSWTPQGPPFPPESPISRTTAEIPFLIRRTFFAVRGAESLYFTRAYSISASSLSFSDCYEIIWRMCKFSTDAES